MDISNAVALDRISSIVGYKLTKGNFNKNTPNLPQRIAIIGEANTANQGTFPKEGTRITSAQQAGQLYGFGSPIYHVARILFPVNGDGVGAIPVVVYAQDEKAGSSPCQQSITITGTASASATHTVIVNGRGSIDGQSYSYNVEAGDSPTSVATKMKDAINAVLGCPCIATSSAGVVTVRTKWGGLTANGLTIVVDNGGVSAGLTYAVATIDAGSGIPDDITDALEEFGNDWNTIVVNTYGLDNIVMPLLENFNGKPDPTSPTGRYRGTIMKPFIAVSGSTVQNPSTLVVSRKNECTIAVAPAPLSSGFQFEAAANMSLLFAIVSNETPHLDVQGMSYPDMPTPAYIGVMNDSSERDLIVKSGCSTVKLVDEKYQVVDFVTTYRPDGEIPPQFRYCRNLMLDFNVRFGYYMLELTHVMGHALADDDAIVDAGKVIKPKQWKALVRDYAVTLSRKGLISDFQFMQDSIEVQISTTNPDRLNTFFRYKRSGYMRIASTTAEAGFYFGE